MSDNETNKELKNKYIAVMLLHALGDTIGFKNGEWEFSDSKKMDIRMAMELMFEFIALGGVTGISLKNWIISDDTLFHMSVVKSLIKIKDIKKLDENDVNIFKSNFSKTYEEIINDDSKKIYRHPGLNMMKSIKKWENDEKDERHKSFNNSSGGNGCAMRNLCIGLAYYGEKNREKLVDISITTSMLTHNNPIGFLAGLTSAVFIAYAVEKIPIIKWVYLLLDLLNSEIVGKYIDKSDDDIYFAYRKYVKMWVKYIEIKFGVDKKPLKLRSFDNILYRSKFYFDNFSEDDEAIGFSGYSAMIMAYDSVLDCDGHWEKVIYYGILHSGDSDTVGAIAGGIYGGIYGFGDVPKRMLKYLEEKDKLIKYGEKLFEIYGEK